MKIKRLQGFLFNLKSYLRFSYNYLIINKYLFENL